MFSSFFSILHIYIKMLDKTYHIENRLHIYSLEYFPFSSINEAIILFKIKVLSKAYQKDTPNEPIIKNGHI